MAKAVSLKGCDIERVKMLIKEIGKVRCWISGFQAARYEPGKINLHAHVPGEDSLRQIQIILQESIEGGVK
jgi:hypothetical protein